MTIYYDKGAYRAKVVSQGLSASKNGNPQIWLQVQIMESLEVCPVTIEQYTRTIYWAVNENTIDYVLEKLERLGFHGASFRQLDPDHAGHHSFVGQEIEVYCKHENYENQDREKWDLSRPSGPGLTPLDESGARQLDALFGRKLQERTRRIAPPATRASTPPLGVPAQQTSRALATAHESSDDDGSDPDIPF